MYYRLQLMEPSVKSMLLSDSVTAGFTQSIYSQYYINLQIKEMRMMVYLTGSLEKYNAVIQGVKQAILA